MPQSPLTPISERQVMANMGITDQDIERRKRLVGLDANDAQRVAKIRPLITEHADELTRAFFHYLSGFEEARVLLGYADLAGQARALKKEHLVAMVGGVYDQAYVEQRLRLGLLYGRVGLETKVFLGAFNHLLAAMGRLVITSSPDGFDNYNSLHKVAFFDIGLQTDALVHERERTIRRQSEAIRELSTPVLKIRERLLLLPLIGVIDTHRAQMITENLLKAVRGARAKIVVIDVTGVGTIDSKVANHLVQTVSAARLMGARVIVSGISAEVAQSMVAIGIDLAAFTTVGDLQGGLEDAERLLGYRVLHDASAERPLTAAEG